MTAPATNNAPTFGERLARSRMWAGLSQQDMADRLGVHKRSVANYETGRRMPQTDTTVQWAEICDVPISLLLEPLTTHSENRGPTTRYPFPHALPPVLGQLDLFEDAPRSNPLPFVAAA